MIKDVWILWDTKINSSELQKSFPTQYQEFYNSHDLVLSASNILTWWADVSHGVSVLRIKQKLPIKTFCWARFNNSGKIAFRNIYQYIALENTFVESTIHNLLKNDIERITRFLEDFLQENGFSGGIEIDFLFEAKPWHGFGFSGVMSVLLSYLLYIITNKYDGKILENGEINPYSLIFEEIYRFSLSLSNCISDGNGVGGAGNYAVMVPNAALPVVYFIHKTHNSDSQEPTHLIETAIYKDSLVKFLWVNPNIQELPLDYGVLFTGMEYRFSEIESTRERSKQEQERLRSFITNSIDSLEVTDDDRIKLSELLQVEDVDDTSRLINNCNLKILEGFGLLLRNIHNENSAEVFIDIIKKVGSSSFSYQKENKLFLAIKYLFYKYRQFDDEEIGVIPFNSGKVGGSLLFALKSGKSRTTIRKVLEDLHKDGHIVSLDYASWRDGYCADGVRIEQYISHGVYSEYTKKGNVIFEDTHGVSYFGDYDSVIKDEQNCILLDTIRRRIYINGSKLTSKQIHSQNTAIDMLRILIENIGGEVSNSQLPVSTYSQNKNEILGKVILPIQKLAKEYFWKEIPLVCSGWISNYYLRMERDESIRIGILKKP